MAISPRPDNFRFLNREGRWLDFHWSGLALAGDGALELLRSPLLSGTRPDLSAVATPNAPAGVATDVSGRTYFSNPEASAIYTVGGCSQEPAPLTCLVEGVGLAPLKQPRGLLLLEEQSRLVVVDSGNHRILFFDTQTLSLREVWGQPDITAPPVNGAAAGEFDTPWTVSVDGDQNLYVLDYGNSRVQKLRQTGEADASFASKLQQSSLIKAPTALAVCGKGNEVRVFIFDAAAKAIFFFNADGTAIVDSMGQPTSIPASAGVLALAASEDRLYVGDNALRSVLAYQVSPSISSCGTAVGFSGPIAALAIDPAGAIVVLAGTPVLPLHLAASSAFVPLGVLWSSAFSTGAPTTVWNRLRAKFDDADGTYVELHYALSGSPQTPPVFPSAADPFSDPAWSALPRNVEDFLLGGDAAHFLFLGAIFRGDRTSTPRLKQIHVTYNDPGHISLLPAIYREPSDPFLTRLLALFQGIFDDVEDEIDTLTRFFSPDAAPLDTLPWLESWLAVEIEQGEPVPQIRSTIARAFSRYQWRGTAEGLKLALLEDAGVHANIVQPIMDASFWNFQVDTSCSGVPSTPAGVSLGASSRLPDMQPGGAVLGSTAELDHTDLITEAQFGEPLFDGLAYQFFVEVYRSEIAGKGRRELVCQIVEREKPAHTMWWLSVIEPSMRIGTQARVGIDSIVAGVRRPWGLGSAATSGGLRLAGPPSPRIGMSRLGHDLKLDD